MQINQSSLTGIYRSFNTIFNKSYMEAPSQCDLVAMRTPSTSKSTNYPWLGDYPMMREWVGDRVIKDLSAFDYTIKNKKFESTVGVLADDIEDDEIGVYTPKIQALGQAAKQHPDVLVFSLMNKAFGEICYDGQYYFDSDHPVGDGSVSNTGGGTGVPWFLVDLSRPIKPFILQVRKKTRFIAMDKPDDENVFMRDEFRYGVDDRKNVGLGLWQLAYGSKQTLDATSYAASRAAMMSFMNDEGVPLGIMPTHLIVPPILEQAGRKLLKVDKNDSGAGNEWFESVELVVVPWLASS